MTSLIEAHGTDAATILRPAWDGTPGWPVLVPIANLDALRGVAAGPDAAGRDRRARRRRTVTDRRGGRPRGRPRRRDPVRGPAAVRRPARPARRPHPRMGRRRRKETASTRACPAKAAASRRSRRPPTTRRATRTNGAGLRDRPGHHRQELRHDDPSDRQPDPPSARLGDRRQQLGTVVPGQDHERADAFERDRDVALAQGDDDPDRRAAMIT